MKTKFYYSYRVMRGTQGYSHPTITIYEPGIDGEFTQYRDIGEVKGQCHDADKRYDEPGKPIPYALRAEIKLHYGNALLMAKIISDLSKLGPWGVEYRAIVGYLRKHGERMIYDRAKSDYIPARHRKTGDLYREAKKRGIALKRAA